MLTLKCDILKKTRKRAWNFSHEDCENVVMIWGDSIKRTITFLLLAVAIAFSSASAEDTQAQVEPDYTKGGALAKPGRNYAALGPTGASGYIWAVRGPLTRDARMILVKNVDKGTPADGVLQAGDVILGVDGKRFTYDVRKALASAITEAEKKENDGKLVLTLWRDGKERTSELRLPVLGSFSKTSPWNCEKTEAIIKAECSVIATRGIDKAGDGVACCVDALGLLATGDKQYWPLVRKYIDKLDKDSKAEGFEKTWTWYVAYANLLICEYYLASKDETVLPIIKTYSNRISMGRSGVGTWSHEFADPAQNDGKPFGMPAGYGAMNQIGLTCTLSLVLAQKCGIDNEDIATAIKKSTALLSFYADKGSICYGDGEPWTKTHENNGVSSQAAVLFDIVGNKQAATFFTRMTLASYNERENGHTGHFFNWNWGALGAARGGEEAAASFVKNTRWFTELERCPDGSSVYQHQLADIDHGKYTGWSTTGSRLLQHCLPRRQLYITGKGGGVVEPIIGGELQEIVSAQEIEPGAGNSIEELLKLLGHWSPTVRIAAARELNRREDDVVDKLIAMLDSDNCYARYGACTGLRYAGRGSAKAVSALVEKGLRSDSPSMRYFAAEAFMANPYWKNEGHNLGDGATFEKTLGPAIHLALPDLVKAAVRDYPDEARPWTQAYIGQAVFGNHMLRDRGPAGTGLMAGNQKAWNAIDIQTRIKLIEFLLQHESGNVRACVGYNYANLSEEELAALMPAIHKAVEYQAPSGAMFGGNVRLEGLKILAKHNIKEGIDAGFKWTCCTPGWGDHYRKDRGFPVLASYGAALKSRMPEIQRAIGGRVDWLKKKKQRNAEDERAIKDLEEALRKVESTPAPELVTIEEFQKAVEERNKQNRQ